MNYYRYIRSRMLDISYVRGRLVKLFSVLSDNDYSSLQALLIQAEGILKRYLEGEGQR